MAQNDFLTWAVGSGANVLSQTDYVGYAPKALGYVSGIAPSVGVNKNLRQSSIMASMIGQFIVDYSGEDAIDDGTTSTLEANFVIAIGQIAGGRVITIPDVVGLTDALNGKLSTTGNAASASKLATSRTITLGGIATGSTLFDGTANVTINTSIADGALTVAKTSGLQASLDGKQPILGYTPVQQGGGSGMTANKLFMGWSSNGLVAQVDGTPLGPVALVSMFGNSLGTNGLQRLPGGLIMQWGKFIPGSPLGEGPGPTLAFPTAFPNAVLNIQFQNINLAGANNHDTWLDVVNASNSQVTTFVQWVGDAGANFWTGCYWFAIGY